MKALDWRSGEPNQVGTGGMTGEHGSWCILRTTGRQTLRLAQTLAEDGFEVWTPSETVTIRIARRNSRRSATLPIMPGYVFARFSRALELLHLSRSLKEGRGTGTGRPNHHQFSIWVSNNRAWSVSDEDLQALREHEEAARRRAAERARRELAKQKAQPLPIGVSVRVKEGSHGAFEGMVGRVTRSDEGNSKIIFIGWKRDVTIRTSLLDLDEVGGQLFLHGTPHRMRSESDMCSG